MSLINLSVCAIPFSVNGRAGIDLIVSVTDHDGAPYTGLGASNFTTKWIVFASEQPLTSSVVTPLAALPGVYDVSLQSEHTAWGPSGTGVHIFYIAVRSEAPQGLDQGQILYTLDPAFFVQPNVTE
jgi:hypothetical protein